MSECLLERFLAKVYRSEDGCWHWAACLNSDGYGRFSVKSDGQWESEYAHRVSYRLHVVEIPSGLTLDHLCRNRACVNPAHLEPVDKATNSLRGESSNAINARKTHCMRGHELAGGNLYITPSGYRNCRTCRNNATKKWHEARR